MGRNIKIDEELAKALSMIRMEPLFEALKNNAKEEVGRNGNSFGKEVAEAFKLCGKCYINDGVNFYSTRAFSYVELDAGERIIASKKAYVKAANKIFYINTLVKKFTGKSFLLKKVNLRDDNQAIALVDAYEMCIRHTLLSE